METTQAASDRQSPVLKEMMRVDDRALREWMDNEIPGEQAVKVGITRKRPLLGPNGENIAGSLETVEDRIDEDYLRENWGGGDYLLKFWNTDATGSWKYFKSRTVKLAGPPKMHGQVLLTGQAPSNGADHGSAPERDSMAERAFNAMMDDKKRIQERADKMSEQPRQSGFDVAALEAFNRPLIEQLRSAQDTIANLQTQVIAAVSKPPPTDAFRDRLMERAIEGESGRIEALRAQYESRIDRLRDNHEDQIKRLEDRHVDDIKRLEARHARELDAGVRAIDGQIKHQDMAFAARLDSLKSDNARLERDLTAAAAKIATLEARKDQSISDKADELIKVREALDGIGGGDDKDKAWYEKLVDAVGNSEAAIGFLQNKFGGAGGAPPGGAPQQPQLPPPGVPFQGADGQTYVHDGQGNYGIVNQAQLRQQQKIAAARKRKRAQAAAAEAGVADEALGDDDASGDGAVPAAEEIRPPNAAEVKIAISFMENAINSGTDPAAFARTAQSLIPRDILTYIQRVGIDEFLNKVAGLESGSPLTTQRGRAFAKSVAKFLLEGTTE